MLDDDSDDEDGQFDDEEIDEDLDLDPEGAQRQGTRQKVDPRREVTYQVSGTRRGRSGRGHGRKWTPAGKLHTR